MKDQDPEGKSTVQEAAMTYCVLENNSHFYIPKVGFFIVLYISGKLSWETS